MAGFSTTAITDSLLIFSLILLFFAVSIGSTVETRIFKKVTGSLCHWALWDWRLLGGGVPLPYLGQSLALILYKDFCDTAANRLSENKK